ncbi:MAG: alpha/beta fold hydrolase [Flavobacteriales bacterium]|nr:alpha/beta fold hydrolase [Flavobacteriales bacterium]
MVTKVFFQGLDLFFPSISAKLVYNVMSNPRVRKSREIEEKILDTSRKERLKFKNFDIQMYRWGDLGNKVVLLIHGWEGQAGNFGGIVDSLLQKNYQVIAFDAPSHGKSSNGKTNMLEFAEFVSFMLKKYHPDAIISHSLGSVTTVVALDGNKDIPINQWFLITTPHSMKDKIKEVSDFLGVTDRTINRLIKMIEKDAGESIDRLNMSDYCVGLTNVSEAIIVHSKDDKVLSIDLSRRVHKDFPQSKLIELDDLGHYTILWSEELKEIISTRLQ